VVGPEGLSELSEINAMRCQTLFDDPKPRLALRGECQTFARETICGFRVFSCCMIRENC
jgi:hypothetical protein